MIKRLLFGLLVLLMTNAVFAQRVTELPRLIEKDGRHALLVDGKPFLILGGQAHNSSAWPGMLPQVWTAIEAMHANTLEVPIYWEQIEPQPGVFDFSVLDTLLVQARAHEVKLILLWFATWKNGSNHYMPEWMKQDAKRYPNITGKDGRWVDSPSPHTQSAMELDAKAFTEVMKHLKEADSQHTVIMVQVQNEPGAWGSVRDYSKTAQKLFDAQVPMELLKASVLNALNKPVVAKGTWTEVFGTDADEYFHAWSVAHYIEFVAAAGKKVNNLPLVVNAALRDPLSNPSADNYESGGPTDNVIPIWKAAAPSIDLLAPDIYLAGSERVLKVLELYSRPDNALFVPEIRNSDEYARYLYAVLGHGGIGFSPFGIDDNGAGWSKAETEERYFLLGQDYATLRPMMHEMAQWCFDGKVKAVVEHEDREAQTIDLGAWKATISFGVPLRNRAKEEEKPFGKALIVSLGENEFLLMGTNCHFTFEPQGKNKGKAWQYLKVEEGQYQSGTFKLLRIRNGDETDWGGPRIGANPVVLHTTLVVR